MISLSFILLLLLYSSSISCICNALFFSASSSFHINNGHPYHRHNTHLSSLANQSSESNSGIQSKRTRIKPANKVVRKRQQHYNLTILLPAYNELHRIGDTLDTYVNYMRCHPVYQFPHYYNDRNDDSYSSNDDDASEQSARIRTTGECSFLVVDDGSTDGMSEFIQQQSWFTPTTSSSNVDYKEENVWKVKEQVKCISLPYNQGKGAAIARGMMELDTTRQLQHQQQDNNSDDHDDVSANDDDITTTRSLVLVADADGSANISSLDDMLHSLECLLHSSSNQNTFNSTTIQTTISEQVEGMAIVVGKRQYPQSKKSPLRSLLSWGFKTCVSLLFIGASTTNSDNSGVSNALGVSDTQCGFKLMTTPTGKRLYHNLNLMRWSHDVEVLYRASCLYDNIAVGECDVDWVDKDGSKLVSSGKDAVVMSAVMLGEIGWMRVMYALERWRVGLMDGE